MKYWYFKSAKNNEWYWRLRADNNRIIAVSGEGYKNKSDCVQAIGFVQGSRYAPVAQSTATN
jgi:uncharacterized protein YegP (UPF0339 family)